MPYESFKVKFKETFLCGDELSGASRKNLLFLHGGGSADRNRFKPLRERLHRKGFGSVAFDFVGHGETGGDKKTSSLKQQVEEAQVVIQNRKIEEPLTLMGSSMGAYIAVKLTKHLKVENLILSVPGMYTLDAFEVPFNETFSEIIRRPKSWESSDAWEIVSEFTGNLMVFGAGKDNVIPRDIVERLYMAATRARSREIVEFPESPHAILPYFAENTAAADTASEKIAALFN